MCNFFYFVLVWLFLRQYFHCCKKKDNFPFVFLKNVNIDSYLIMPLIILTYIVELIMKMYFLIYIYIYIVNKKFKSKNNIYNIIFCFLIKIFYFKFINLLRVFAFLFFILFYYCLISNLWPLFVWSLYLQLQDMCNENYISTLMRQWLHVRFIVCPTSWKQPH